MSEALCEAIKRYRQMIVTLSPAQMECHILFREEKAKVSNCRALFLRGVGSSIDPLNRISQCAHSRRQASLCIGPRHYSDHKKSISYLLRPHDTRCGPENPCHFHSTYLGPLLEHFVPKPWPLSAPF